MWAMHARMHAHQTWKHYFGLAMPVEAGLCQCSIAAAVFFGIAWPTTFDCRGSFLILSCRTPSQRIAFHRAHVS